MAEQQIFFIFAEQFHLAIGRHAINAIGRVSGDVEVAVRIEGQAIGDAGHAFDENFRRSRAPVRLDCNSGDAVAIAFDDVEVTLLDVERHAVGEMIGAGGEQTGFALARKPPHHAVALLPFSGVAEK